MNVIELLKKDHETVSGLFKSFEAAKEAESEPDKEQIVGQICEALTAHAAVEEELFYPAVARQAGEDEKAEDSVREANEEHAIVKNLVAELEEMSASDEQYEAKVKVLKDVVEHHVEEEEGQLMPKAKKLLSSDQLEQLGARVESRKAELESGAAPKPAASKAASRSSSSRASSSRSSSSRSGRSSSSSSRGARASRASRASRTSRSGRGRSRSRSR
jgi:hemerythrin superfamily protein